MKKYSIGINGLRGLFALIIVLFHFELFYSFGEYKIFSSGYFAVEFFFILSGFLICKNFIQKDKKSISEAIASKVKKMYPAYILALFALISVYVAKWYNFNYILWLKQTPNNIKLLTESLMLQSTGISNFKSINGPSWYVSSLIVNTGIIIGLLKIFKKFRKVTFLIITCLIYSYFYFNHYSMSPNYFVYYIFSSAVLRGLAGMSLGALTCLITIDLSKKINNFPQKLFNLLEITLFVGLLSLLILHDPGKSNYFILVISSILIMLLFSKDGIIDKLFHFKFLQFFGNISFEFYIFQSACSNFVICFLPQLKQPYATITYLFINLTIATLVYLIYNKLILRRKNEV